MPRLSRFAPARDRTPHPRSVAALSRSRERSARGARTASSLQKVPRIERTCDGVPNPERDEHESDLCASCGGPIDERGFRFGPTGALCSACAGERGGVYDAERERWEVEPELGGLVDERRVHH